MADLSVRYGIEFDMEATAGSSRSTGSPVPPLEQA